MRAHTNMHTHTHVHAYTHIHTHTTRGQTEAVPPRLASFLLSPEGVVLIHPTTLQTRRQAHTQIFTPSESNEHNTGEHSEAAVWKWSLGGLTPRTFVCSLTFQNTFPYLSMDN